MVCIFPFSFSFSFSFSLQTVRWSNLYSCWRQEHDMPAELNIAGRGCCCWRSISFHFISFHFTPFLNCGYRFQHLRTLPCCWACNPWPVENGDRILDTIITYVVKKIMRKTIGIYRLVPAAAPPNAFYTILTARLDIPMAITFRTQKRQFLDGSFDCLLQYSRIHDAIAWYHHVQKSTRQIPIVHMMTAHCRIRKLLWLLFRHPSAERRLNRVDPTVVPELYS